MAVKEDAGDTEPRSEWGGKLAPAASPFHFMGCQSTLNIWGTWRERIQSREKHTENMTVKQEAKARCAPDILEKVSSESHII